MSPPQTENAVNSFANENNDTLVADIESLNAPTTLTRTVTHPASSNSGNREIKLLFIGCEEKEPYGPIHHTASMFLDLISQAIQQNAEATDNSSNVAPTATTTITIRTFNACRGIYPSADDHESAHGVILPGSFSSAYDNDDWIVKLRQEYIQQQLVANEIPTLGICFGHQIMAHSFTDGSATKTPTGPRCGRHDLPLTAVGQEVLQTKQSTIDMYVTHNDMVATVPADCAKILGGNSDIPAQAVAYYSRKDNTISGNSVSNDSSTTDSNDNTRKIFALTFQAHPEYASSRQLGLEKSLVTGIQKSKTLVPPSACNNNGDSADAKQQDEKDAIISDARQHFDRVQEHSIDVMRKCGGILGWW